MKKFSIILLVLMISLVSLGAESLQNLFRLFLVEKFSRILLQKVIYAIWFREGP